MGLVFSHAPIKAYLLQQVNYFLPFFWLLYFYSAQGTPHFIVLFQQFRRLFFSISFILRQICLMSPIFQNKTNAGLKCQSRKIFQNIENAFHFSLKHSFFWCRYHTNTPRRKLGTQLLREAGIADDGLHLIDATDVHAGDPAKLAVVRNEDLLT